MNKYEENIMANVHVMKIGYVILALVNLLVPFHNGWVWRFSVFQLAIVIIWFFGLLGGLGYFDQLTPILPIGIVRILQIGSYLLFKSKTINWTVLVVFIVIDVIYLVFLLFDKANYAYEIVEEDEDGA